MPEKLQKQLISDDEVRQVLEKINSLPKDKRVALVVHKNPPPDPDALASALAWQMALDDRGIKSDIFSGGAISHPQNIAMINCLKIELRDEKYWERNSNNYGLVIFCDTCHNNAAINVRPDIIFDHHMNSPIIDGCLNLIKKVGANSTIVYHLLKKIGAEFSHPSLIATALAVGIDTDTKSLAKVDEVTEFDLSAHRELLSLVDYALFKHLTERFEVTRGFFKCLKMALSENIDAIFVGSMAVLGVGEIKQSQIDYIPLIADMVLRTEQVRLVVVIVIVEGQFIKASVRTDLESIQIDQFCKEVLAPIPNLFQRARAQVPVAPRCFLAPANKESGHAPCRKKNRFCLTSNYDTIATESKKSCRMHKN